MIMLNKIAKYFKLNPDPISDPDMYLVSKLRYHRTKNGVYTWSLRPSKYDIEAVNNCVKHLRKNFEGEYSLTK